MRKLILVNGVITLVGLLLDIYGIYDLSLFPAALGLILGVIDCVTFLLMREEIKETFRRLKARQVVFQPWFEKMKQGEPQVVATITGRPNRVLFAAKELGYEVTDISETRGKVFTKYTVTFRLRRNLNGKEEER
ncbi:MAG: hypothetical protein NWF14_02350 [Candidatus Bathyarchaeota archaeon]|nr:hypothetical protein [Candidatus Bathyarchaeota archaeon]